MKKKLTLCTPCAMTLGECFDLKQLPRERDKKVVCDQCGRKRYGAEYAVGRKAAAK